MEILHIENLSFKYPKTEKNAVDDVTLNIKKGEFVVVCGSSGCGKTTLLRLLKRELAPCGERSGTILYKGKAQNELDEKESACKIGFVMQNPDSQIVTDKVWHELAFGLENMGVKTEAIRLRVGETASYFGIQHWFRKNTDELSGGEKQLLNLAAIMVMQPEVLILDEPTSQLDPIAASDFISTLKKLNRETGLTVIIAEHRLEEIFPIADKVLVMDDGKAVVYDEPRNVGDRLCDIDKDHPMLLLLPSAVRIFNAVSRSLDMPSCDMCDTKDAFAAQSSANDEIGKGGEDNVNNKDGKYSQNGEYGVNNEDNKYSGEAGEPAPAGSGDIPLKNALRKVASPLTVNEGRAFLEEYFGKDQGSGTESGTKSACRMSSGSSATQQGFDTQQIDTQQIDKQQNFGKGKNEGTAELAVELKNVWFRYEKDLPDVLRGLTLNVYKGELFCIVGGNGTGKTTMLNVIAGVRKAYRGKIAVGGRQIKEYKKGSLYRENLALLPQDPQTVFIKDKVRDDLLDILTSFDIKKDEREKLVDDVAERLCITHLLDKHPYDLSGGEQQKCAIAKMLLLKPKILLFDEPTKGLDAYSKYQLGELLAELKRSGITIIMVTHDIEFAAENADRCALFFDGELISQGRPDIFFAENNFYTTAASRMARNVFKNAVTCDQVVKGCLCEINGGEKRE